MFSKTLSWQYIFSHLNVFFSQLLEATILRILFLQPSDAPGSELKGDHAS